MHTRLLENKDGSLHIEWSEDGGSSWNQSTARRFWMRKLAEKEAKRLHPGARFIGTMKAA